jgi:hypothetical protein
MRPLLDNLTAYVALAALVNGVASVGEASEWTAAEVVTSYVSGTSPTLILGFDNNLEICLALQDPRTTEDLAISGVPATRSQIVLLKLWDLLEDQGNGILRCKIPVVQPPASDEIRALAEEIAEQLLEVTHDPILAFLDTVGRAGWSDNGYVLVGSFVLDGLVWEAFEELEVIATADASLLPTGSEYWSGVSWITLPPQSLKLGTNSHSAEHGTLYAGWTPPALEAQAELRRDGLREALIAGAAGVSSADPTQAQVLRDLRLLRGEEFRVPAVVGGSALCQNGGSLAKLVATTLLETPELHAILTKTGASDDSVAMIMAYHWIYPALLARLEAVGLEPPRLLTGEPDGQLAPTLLVVKADADCI